ncbi:MAG: hypothetical protein KY475_18215 [Planctomycetes bacterium]|nr:hypothetical protein [Planctomycetota bacterium]
MTETSDVARHDHDQRFKTLLKEFIGPFFELFWPERARLFNFGGVEWLENEAFPDPPEGRRRSLDLVCKLPLRQPVVTARGAAATGTVVIIHVEVESADTAEPLRLRMFQYFSCLRQKYTEPILPVAVYLRVGLDGIGADSYEERFGDFEVVRYNYLYVGLPALEAESYLNRGDALAAALAATMSIPADRRAETKVESLSRVVASGEDEYRTFLLTEFVQAYFPLRSPEEQAKFEQLLARDEYSEVKAMATTWYEEGLEEGRKLGRRATILEVLEKRFAPLPHDIHSRIEKCPEAKLGELLDRALTAPSLAELRVDDFLG